MCKYNSREWILMGVQSFASTGPAVDNIAFYTRVADYAQWISDSINKNGGPGPF